MSDKQPLGPLQTKWIEELRSGNNGQVIGIMGCEKGYCCLGLAAHKVLEMEPAVYHYKDSPEPPPEGSDKINYWTFEAGQDESVESFYVFGEFTETKSGVSQIDPSIELVRWEDLGLRNSAGRFTETYDGEKSLADMNDNGKTFAEIAAFIEENPEMVFTEPK